jgi:flavin reductase (DIM6/NTAB) family NADH-FMN oxidoreductase RutF
MARARLARSAARLRDTPAAGAHDFRGTLAFMDWDLGALAPAQRYKLLVGLVVPRPIALVSTRSPEGMLNAAPFSFFNVLGDEPPIVIVSIEDRPDGRVKDSARNIAATGEFVVNLVDETIAERMHGCSLDYPPEVSEFDAVGFTPAESRAVKPPRIAEAPVALECVLHQTIEIETRHLMIGRIKWLHVRDGLVDPDTLRVHIESYFPVGRLYANRYVRTRDQFALESNRYNEAMQRLGRA